MFFLFLKTFISDRNAYLNEYDSEFFHHNLCIDCEEFIDNIVTEINSTICSMTYPSLIDISSHFSKSLTSLICTQYFFYLVNMITSSFIPHTFPNTTIQFISALTPFYPLVFPILLPSIFSVSTSYVSLYYPNILPVLFNFTLI